MVIATIWALLTDFSWMISLWAMASFGYWIWESRGVLGQFSPWGGYANWATAGRVVLLSLISCLVPFLTEFQLFMCIWLPLSLDAVDGFLARKFNHGSAFGQYFDMEADAFYVLLLSFLLFHLDKVGAWMLLPGVLRYIYVIVIALLGWQDREIPGSFIAKVIGAGFFIMLPFPLIIPTPLGAYVAAGMTGLLFWSFGLSFFQLWELGKQKNSNE